MLSLITFQPLKALPSFTPPPPPPPPPKSSFINNPTLKYLPFNSKPTKTPLVSTVCHSQLQDNNANATNSCNSLWVQLGLFATVAEPAIAVTGVNDEPDLVRVLIQIGVMAFFYFLIAPPIIMNWLRIRWYRRNLLEMYFQFMFVFIFFPGVLLWAPFLNFRKFPRDPNMKYPWSKPENPDEIRGGFLKYPWGSIEDYE